MLNWHLSLKTFMTNQKENILTIYFLTLMVIMNWCIMSYCNKTAEYYIKYKKSYCCNANHYICNKVCLELGYPVTQGLEVQSLIIKILQAISKTFLSHYFQSKKNNLNRCHFFLCSRLINTIANVYEIY